MSTAVAGGEPQNSSPPAPANGTVAGWKARWHRWRKDPGAAIPGLAAVILGFVVGHLTGLSGPDDTVLAAVLSAILSAGGAVAAFLTAKGYVDKHHTRVISGLIILFSLALLAGAHVGSGVRISLQSTALSEAQAARQKEQEAARSRWQEEQEAARSRYSEDLKKCTILEFQMNARRADLDLPPFTILQVCPFLDDPQLAPAQMPE